MLVWYIVIGLWKNVRSPYTTPEILDYMSDLKVLGKGELMALLKWRMRIRR